MYYAYCPGVPDLYPATYAAGVHRTTRNTLIREEGYVRVHANTVPRRIRAQLAINPNLHLSGYAVIVAENECRICGTIIPRERRYCLSRDCRDRVARMYRRRRNAKAPEWLSLGEHQNALDELGAEIGSELIAEEGENGVE